MPAWGTRTSRPVVWDGPSISTTRRWHSDPRFTICGISWGACSSRPAGPSMRASTSRSSSGRGPPTSMPPRCSGSPVTSPGTGSPPKPCGRIAANAGRRIRGWRPISPCWRVTTPRCPWPCPAESRVTTSHPPRPGPTARGGARGRGIGAGGARRNRETLGDLGRGGGPGGPPDSGSESAAGPLRPTRGPRCGRSRRHGGSDGLVAGCRRGRGGCAHDRLAPVCVRDERRAGARLRHGGPRIRGRHPAAARARRGGRSARGIGSVLVGRRPAPARRRQAGGGGGLVSPRQRARRTGGCGPRGVHRPGRREAGPGRRRGGPRELSAGADRGHSRRHDHAARAAEDQCAGEGGRTVAGPAETTVRTMRRLRLIAAAVVAAACHHGPRVMPAPDPVADLTRARALLRQGKFNKALVLFRRLAYEIGPTQPEMAEVQYDLAECYFQTGDRVQAAHDFRQVADQFPTSDYAALALLRAGDANVRLWKDPELDPSYGETALAIYQELGGRYPGTEAAARGQVHVRQLREWFSQKDYKNGMFYFKRRAFDSAIIYFKDVIANYAGTSRVPDALMRLVDSYRVIGYADELKETCEHLRRFFPQTEGLDKSCPADSSAAAPS